MTLLPADYRIPMLVGAEADVALDRLFGITDARQTVLVPTLNAARNGYGVPGRLAVPSAPGLRAWTDGSEELRLRAEPYGWTVPVRSDLDNAGLVISPSGDTAIAMVAGNDGTGLPGYTPQVRYRRGQVASEFVQGSMFLDVVAEETPVDLWFLLHNISTEGWRAELSKAAEIGRSGWVEGWRTRIQILPDIPPSADDRIEIDGAPELPSPVVRWRDSA